MTLKTIATGSTGNSYILTSDRGKHLILDAGIPIGEIKKGLDFDIGNVCACIITHVHKDHSLSANKLKTMGIPVWQPYLSDKVRMRTQLGEFEVECFDVYHDGTPCRAFIITVGEETILYCTDFEYVAYDLSKKNLTVMLVELNYLSELVSDDNDHLQHLVRGHAEAKTTLELVKHNSNKLHTVLFCHMSMSGSLDRDKVAQMVPNYIPAWCKWGWCKAGETYNIDSIPF